MGKKRKLHPKNIMPVEERRNGMERWPHEWGKTKKKLNASKTAFVISVLPLLLLSHISGYIKFQRQQQNPKKNTKTRGCGQRANGKMHIWSCYDHDYVDVIGGVQWKQKK